MMKINKIVFSIGLIWMLAIGHAFAQDISNVELNESSTRAIITAADKFRADGNKMNTYRIALKQDSHEIEVVFIPALVKSNNLIGADISDLPEIHYFLDSSGRKILRRLDGQ